MSPNDTLAQQQVILNQAMQNYQHMMGGLAALSLATIIIGALVTYAFYARLRDIADEIRKFRIAYEFAHTPESRPPPRREPAHESPRPVAPKPRTPTDDHAKYLPKA
jgi:hypothetical protein